MDIWMIAQGAGILNNISNNESPASLSSLRLLGRASVNQICRLLRRAMASAIIHLHFPGILVIGSRLLGLPGQ